MQGPGTENSILNTQAGWIEIKSTHWKRLGALLNHESRDDMREDLGLHYRLWRRFTLAILRSAACHRGRIVAAARGHGWR